jgi:phage/plasmid-like protein (TIGR03299 family)
LGEGERVWILAKLDSQIRVTSEDVTDKYLLLSNSHDGTSSVQIKFTPIRVVCENTLTLALSRGPTVRVAHTRDLYERLRSAEKALGIIHKRFNDIEESFKAMAGVQMNAKRLSEYLERVFPNPSDPEDERAVGRVRRDRSWSEYFFTNGKGNSLAGTAGTLWAAYNAVAEYIDHRKTKQTDEDRLQSVWFGDGYHVKARAYAVAETFLRNGSKATPVLGLSTAGQSSGPELRQ